MKKRYFITSIVPGADVHMGFLASIETYCKKNNAELLLLPTPPTVSKHDTIDDALAGHPNLVMNDRRLNSKIRISTIPVKPDSVDPVAGLQRQSQKDGSFIFSSPKQRLKVVPNGHSKLPHALMTTGAITYPYYRTDRRIGRIAEGDHVIGGLIVEVETDTYYHFRQVQADKKGAFVDLGIRYGASGTSTADTEAIIPGDIHAGETDPQVKKVVLDLAKELNPKHLILHDLFNGLSVNHHIRDMGITREALGNAFFLEKELEVTYNELLDYAKVARSVEVIRSNHDLWIDDYLEEGIYAKEIHNARIGRELATKMASGVIPLEAGVRRFDKDKSLKNVRFLKLDEDFKLTPKRIQCGAHGHAGSNGARGTTASMEKAYGESISGHTHTPEILRGAFVTGTSTFLNLGYNQGASSWLQTLCILYSDGSRQLVNVIDGKYRLNERAKSSKNQ